MYTALGIQSVHLPDQKLLTSPNTPAARIAQVVWTGVLAHGDTLETVSQTAW